MRGRNPHDEHHLQIDLLEQLLAAGAIKPTSVSVVTVRQWFPTRESHLADELVAELAANRAAPLQYVTAERQEIWLSEGRATREFLDDLRENPPWFDS